MLKSNEVLLYATDDIVKSVAEGRDGPVLWRHCAGLVLSRAPIQMIPQQQSPVRDAV